MRSNYGFLDAFHEREGKHDHLTLTTEEILQAWFNRHLPSDKKLSNFSSDLADSTRYALLFRSLAPAAFDNIEYVFEEKDLVKRGELLLRQAEKIDCRVFLTPADIAHVSILKGGWKKKRVLTTFLFFKNRVTIA